MKLSTTVLLALALVALMPSATSASAAGKWHRCGKIGFQRASDNVATKIRARGTSCKGARKVVRGVHQRGRKRPYGYRCKRRVLDTPLPLWRWRCVKGSHRVRWTKS